MNVKINNLDTIHITLPAFMCFLWQHLVWFLGLLLIVLSHIVPYLPGVWQTVASVTVGVLVAAVGYIKSQPQPQLLPVPKE